MVSGLLFVPRSVGQKSQPGQPARGPNRRRNVEALGLKSGTPRKKLINRKFYRHPGFAPDGLPRRRRTASTAADRRAAAAARLGDDREDARLLERGSRGRLRRDHKAGTWQKAQCRATRLGADRGRSRLVGPRRSGETKRTSEETGGDCDLACSRAPHAASARAAPGWSPPGRLKRVERGKSSTLGRPEAGCSGRGEPPHGGGGAPGCAGAA